MLLTKHTILAFYLSLQVSLLGFETNSFCADLSQGHAIFQESTLDLSQGNWTEGPIEIHGPWNFYWNRLLDPQNPWTPSPMISPSIPWERMSELKSQAKDLRGSASYRLKIQGLPVRIPLTLMVPSNTGATKAFLYPAARPEEALSFEVGKVDSGSTVFTKRRVLLRFEARQAEDFILLLQLSNHANAYGGFWAPPQLGRSDIIEKHMYWNDFLTVLSLGISLTLAVYAFLLWRQRRADRLPGYLFLVCIGGTLRNLGTSAFVAQLIGDTHYETLRRLEYMSIPWAVSFVYFIGAFFGVKAYAQMNRALLVTSCLLIFMTFIAPLSTFEPLLFLYQINVLGVCIYSLFILLKAYGDKKPGALLTLMGSGLISIAVLWDIILVTNLHIFHIYLTTLSITIFLMLLGQMIARRATDMQKLAQKLALEREHIQSELRLEVEGRLQLSADIAHKLNNPLNYIRNASYLIESELSKVQEEVLSLFESEPEGDSPVGELRKHYEGRFRELSQPFKQLKEGLSLATQSIVEIRTVSGVDGLHMESFDLRDYLVEALYHLNSPIPSASEFDKIPEHHIVFGNRTILNRTLQKVATAIPNTWRQNMKLHFNPGDEESVSTLSVSWDWTGPYLQNPQAKDLGSSLNYLLRGTDSHIELIWERKHVEIRLSLPRSLNDVKSATLVS